VLADASEKQIESLEIEELDVPVTVYNFEVEDWHTYFVSEIGVLVHNACGQGAGKVLNSVDDIVNNPSSLYGKSKADVKNILGDGWTEKPYGTSKTGWEFYKGDQRITYHPGGGRHGGSYYSYSSGATGRIKIVGPDYIPSPGDKATIIYGE
jgi:hypothetical protein